MFVLTTPGSYINMGLIARIDVVTTDCVHVWYLNAEEPVIYHDDAAVNIIYTINPDLVRPILKRQRDIRAFM